VHTQSIQSAVVFNKPHFAELVHEETDSRAGSANHLRQRFLADLSEHRLRFLVFSEVGQQQTITESKFFREGLTFTAENWEAWERFFDWSEILSPSEIEKLQELVASKNATGIEDLLFGKLGKISFARQTNALFDWRKEGLRSIINLGVSLSQLEYLQAQGVKIAWVELDIGVYDKVFEWLAKLAKLTGKCILSYARKKVDDGTKSGERVCKAMLNVDALAEAFRIVHSSEFRRKDNTVIKPAERWPGNLRDVIQQLIES